METFGIIALLLGLIFGALGLLFLILNKVNRKKAQKALTWPVISGTVVKTDIRQHTSIDDDGTSTTYYEPVVEYTYRVLGQTYTARRIAFGASRFDARTARSKVEQYPQDKTVEVRYNPDKPEDAVLETAVAGEKAFRIVGYIFLVIGLVCGLGGLAAWILSL